MLEIKLTENGFVASREISPAMFRPNTLVSVLCEQPYNGNYKDLEIATCSYLNSLMHNRIEVKTDYVTIDLKDFLDNRGIRFINSLTFQVHL
ncbi:hypothetical protein NG821_12555 [Prevotella cerevisiae]|uniref:Uncharacterized protein n=1 Tax=Segatella cerevisiae TaxID=2053716 RepID=A0ABT1C0J6_9BACT|nr:hypothetical protein [Segatella cerevisiae]MCO6026650.1 hypothetical protein [Segatella cerevisiae]